MKINLLIILFLNIRSFERVKYFYWQYYKFVIYKIFSISFNEKLDKLLN